MSKKNIRFTIYNEDFWGRGLIYSQNFLPLIKLLENNRDLYSVEIHSFLSILDLLLYRKEIKGFKKDFKNLGIKTIIYPTFFVRSRFFILRWYVFPFYILSISPYLLYLMVKDFISYKVKIIYHLRSYPIAFLFTYLYKGKAELIFDPRSDFNHENKKVGFWKENSFSDKIWFNIEKKILNKSSKTIFISEPFLQDVLSRHKIKYQEDKHFIFYNPIDFNKFKEAFMFKRASDRIRFLYTGSLDNWNNLETYLDFFLNIKDVLPEATFYIVTSTRVSKLQHLILKEKYKNIINDVSFFYNLSYDELPNLYKECTVGLQLMDKPDSRIGVKFVEYLAAGLVPIINENVRGAAQLSENGLGFIIKNGDLNDMNKKIFYFLNSEEKIKEHKSIVLANKYLFDVNISYQILSKIYNFD